MILQDALTPGNTPTATDHTVQTLAEKVLQYATDLKSSLFGDQSSPFPPPTLER